MSISFKNVVSYHRCPAEYHYWTTTHIKGLRERGRDLKRVIRVYHDSNSADDRLGAAVAFLERLCDSIVDPQVLGMYRVIFQWLEVYDRIHNGTPRQVLPRAKRLHRMVGTEKITLTVDLVEELQVGQAAWMVSTVDPPPTADAWPATFEGQLVRSTICSRMPSVSVLHVCYLRSGIVHTFPVAGFPAVEGFEAELADTVYRLSVDTDFAPNPGPHCLTCFHLRGQCHPVVNQIGEHINDIYPPGPNV